MRAPPALASISGKHACVTRNVPRTFTSHVFHHCPASTSAAGFAASMYPALLISTSSRPNASSTARAAARTDASSVTSSVSLSTFGADAPLRSAAAPRMALSTSSSAPPERAPIAMPDAPARANAMAVAAPMPLLAPVTSTNLPMRSHCAGSTAG